MASDTATAAAAATASSNGDADAARVISLEEMRKHTTEESCWIAVRGEVFDVTPFIDEHPGGFDIIISNTGKEREGRRGEKKNQSSPIASSFFFVAVLFVLAMRALIGALLVLYVYGRAHTSDPCVVAWSDGRDTARKSLNARARKKTGSSIFFFCFLRQSRRRDRPPFFSFFFFFLSFFSFPPKLIHLFQKTKHKRQTGKDATEDFEEIGHSAAANEMLAKYKIGALKGGDGGKAARKQAASAVSTGTGGAGSSGAVKALQVLLPLLAVLAALLLPKLLAK